MAPLALTDEAIERVEALAAADATAAVLARGARRAPGRPARGGAGRVLDEREYAEIASQARTSESVVRKRVSRGLAGLRSRLEGP